MQTMPDHTLILSETLKFAIARKDLLALLKGADVSKSSRHLTVTLYACSAHVFVECGGEIAGIEHLVLTDGAVTVCKDLFLTLLDTYKGTKMQKLRLEPSL